MAIEFFRNEMMNKMFVPLVATGTAATATVAIAVLSSDSSNNGSLTGIELTKTSSLVSDIEDFTNGLNIYVDASNNLVVGNDSVVDMTLEELIELEEAGSNLEGVIINIPDVWEELFDLDTPVITEEDGEHFITLVWADNGRAVFENGKADLAKVNKDLIASIEGIDNVDYPVSNEIETDVEYDKIRVNAYDFVEAMHMWLWTNDSVGIYNIDGGSYSYNENGIVYTDESNDWAYFNDGTYRFDNSSYLNAIDLIEANFSLQYAIDTIGGLPADYWDTHLHQNRSMLSTDGTDIYFQIYWADGTAVFNEGICLTANYGDEANLLNEYYSQIAEPGRFADYL